MNVSSSLDENIRYLKEVFPIGLSYDLLTRELTFGKTKGYWIGINGFCDSLLLQNLIGYLQDPSFNDDTTVTDIASFMSAKIGFSQAELCSDWDRLIKMIASGPSVLFLDGFDQAILLDARNYPVRSINEPEAEKVNSGSKDGFVETLVFNTALIRRRIRNPKLTFEITSVGTETKTDVAITYIKGQADETTLKIIKDKISKINVPSLTMGAISLEELLVKKTWLHPMPQVRFTERPDVLSSFLLENYVAIIVDNSPTVLVFPCNIFQFTQNAEDYYQNPLVGTYYRTLRSACIFLSLLIMPIFLLLAMNADTLPSWLQVIKSNDLTAKQVFIHVLLVELALDIFRYSSAHAPNSLSNSLGLIGGLIVGDIAVDLHWASQEVIFYGALTLLATVSISSQEFGNALRLYRIFLVLTTGFFSYWGFFAGLVLVIVSIVTTPTMTGKNYLWPLIPFNGRALSTLLVRYPTARYEKKRH